MRFSAATTLLTLAASASAAVLPHSQMGQWDASVTVQPNGDQYVHFEFTSDAYPEKQRSTCVYVQSETPSWKRCDQAAVNYSYDGTTLKISQNVQLPNPMTVFGEAEVPLTETLADGRKKGEAIVPVTSAIA